MHCRLQALRSIALTPARTQVGREGSGEHAREARNAHPFHCGARGHFLSGLLCDEIRDAQETLGGGERSVQRFGLPAEWSPSPSEEEWK